MNQHLPAEQDGWMNGWMDGWMDNGWTGNTFPLGSSFLANYSGQFRFCFYYIPTFIHFKVPLIFSQCVFKWLPRPNLLLYLPKFGPNSEGRVNYVVLYLPKFGKNSTAHFFQISFQTSFFFNFFFLLRPAEKKGSRRNQKRRERRKRKEGGKRKKIFLCGKTHFLAK